MLIISARIIILIIICFRFEIAFKFPKFFYLNYFNRKYAFDNQETLNNIKKKT